ncbi:MAG: hypothetical protein RL272_1125 [Candidatus Parcubacteria bacterium]
MTERKTRAASIVASLLLIGAGCAGPKGAAGLPAASIPDEPTRPAAPAAPAGTPPEVPQFAQCILAATGKVTLYMRADAGSDVFGTLAEGEAVVLGGRTADGWYGFDPASAQAPNVGPFRLRWVKPDGAFTLSGGCTDLPAYPRIPPGTCYVMAQADTPVRESPAGDAKTAATMKYGDFALALGRKRSANAAWVKIDEGSGSLRGAGQGWASMETLDFNGPCEKLPAAK